MRQTAISRPRAAACNWRGGSIPRRPNGGVLSDGDLNDYIRAQAGVTQHPVGTCAMGAGSDAVLDPHLRVRGIAGLRVVDASVMPTVPGGNTNAAVIMIAEKAADLILGHALAPEPARRAIA